MNKRLLDPCSVAALPRRAHAPRVFSPFGLVDRSLRFTLLCGAAALLMACPGGDSDHPPDMSAGGGGQSSGGGVDSSGGGGGQSSGGGDPSGSGGGGGGQSSGGDSSGGGGEQSSGGGDPPGGYGGQSYSGGDSSGGGGGGGGQSSGGGGQSSGGGGQSSDGGGQSSGGGDSSSGGGGQSSGGGDPSGGGGGAPRDPCHDTSPGAQTVSDELDLSIPVYGPRPYDELTPALASDGTNFLLVWSDDRSSTERTESGRSLLAARVAPDGTVLDPVPLTVADGPGDESVPAVTFDGTNYVVVWADDAGFYGPPRPASDIRAARISPDGEVLDPGGFVVSSAEQPDSWPSVVSLGATTLVAWSAEGDGVRFARLSSSGDVLDPGGVSVGSRPMVGRPALATDGAGALLAWDDGELRAARVSADGTVLDPGGVPSATYGQAQPVAAFDGERYWIVWTGDDGVHAAAVAPGSAELDPERILSLAEETTESSNVAAVFDGEQLLVVWQTPHALDPWISVDLRAARVSRAGAVLDPGGVVVASGWLTYSEVALAAGQGSAFAAWMQGGINAPWDIFGVALRGATPDASGPVPVAVSPADQGWPSVVFDGQSYVVVWSDGRIVTHGIYAARVSPSGELLDPSGILVGDTPVTDAEPLAVFDGQNTAVVWRAYDCCGTTELYAARLSPDGVPLDATPILLPELRTNLDFMVDMAVASDGQGVLIAVVDELGEIELIHMDQAGVATLLPPSPPEILGSSVSLGFDGENYLVTWGASDDGRALHGARVSPSGDWLDPVGFRIAREGAPAALKAPAAITRHGAGSLVVWEEENADGPGLYAAEIGADGVVLQPGGVLLAPIDEAAVAEPAVASYGARAVAVWQDAGEAGRDVLGAEIPASGVEPTVFTISANPAQGAWPRVSACGPASALVTYTRRGPTGAFDVRGRLLGGG